MEKFKRKIFYLGGFDPRGVRYYHQMYREQAARHDRLSGGTINVGARCAGPDGSGVSTVWSVTNDAEGVETAYEYLRWEDVVGKVWIRNPLTLAWRSIGTYIGHTRFMQFARMKKLRPGPVLTICYPPFLAVVIPLLMALLPALLLWMVVPFWAAALAGIVISAAFSGRWLKKLVVPWLLRFTYYHHRLAADGPGEVLSERLDRFAARIVRELDEPWDEILFVTHSAGTIQGMSVMRRVFERRAEPMPERFAMLGLGQIVPVVALRRDAHWYHADLKALADKAFRYVDLSFPPDGAAYFDVNPLLLVADRHVARVDMLSSRFHLFYDPQNYHGGMSNKYELHFDYLRVGDRLSPVDFVSLTAGRRTLDEAVAAFRTIP
ncbi:MAG: hypothetical protein AB7E60_07270 [Sphingobium sp.]